MTVALETRGASATNQRCHKFPGDLNQFNAGPRGFFSSQPFSKI
jgi:hypothetical protein